MSCDLSRLDDAQRRLVTRWFGAVEQVHDLSWGVTDTVVLRLRTAGQDVVVKAGGPDNHHIGREISGHQDFLAGLASTGHAPVLLHHDRQARVLATSWVPGELVATHRAAGAADTYRQAGVLLARLHAVAARIDGDWESAERAKALAHLAGPHRIDADTEARLRALLATHPTPPVRVVPTHGDFHPRNWVVEDGVVRLIDLGRAAWRPARTDLARLAAGPFAGRPDLAEAFVAGYGHDLRDDEGWERTPVHEAIGTAVWAYRVGDAAFETQGHRMIAEVLAAHDAHDAP
ncbi:phosphotransferase [Isoptericola jiangsuensis]|uniref:phosphotransferase n=1 Tax=Isoptericola jiangsuensis TaxID=548579 RepID=UPI003AABE45E